MKNWAQPISHDRKASGVTSPMVRKGGLFAEDCSTRATLEDILGLACVLQLESVESESVDICASFEARVLSSSREDTMDVRDDSSRSITGDNRLGELLSSVASSLARLLVVIDDGRIGIRVRRGGSLSYVTRVDPQGQYPTVRFELCNGVDGAVNRVVTLSERKKKV